MNKPEEFDQFGAPMRDVLVRVPDVHSTQYQTALANQIERINASEDEREVMIWIEQHTAEVWRDLD